MFAPSSLIQQAGIENAVDELPVLGDTLAQYSFTLKSEFLEHAHRGGVPFEHRRLEPHEARIRREEIEKCAPGRGGESAAPVRFAEPITDCAVRAKIPTPALAPIPPMASPSRSIAKITFLPGLPATRSHASASPSV
jgi:hypothetical protein